MRQPVSAATWPPRPPRSTAPSTSSSPRSCRCFSPPCAAPTAPSPSASGQLRATSPAASAGDPARRRAEKPGSPITTVTLDGHPPAGHPRPRRRLRPPGPGDLRSSGSTHSAERTGRSSRRSRRPTTRSRRPARRGNTAPCPTGSTPSPKEHVRWVLDADEEKVIDAVTRLHARRESALCEGAKYVGSFRASLLDPCLGPAQGRRREGRGGRGGAFRTRFEEALTCRA